MWFGGHLKFIRSEHKILLYTCSLLLFFKMFSEIEDLYGCNVLRTVRSYVRDSTCVVRQKNQISFNFVV